MPEYLESYEEFIFIDMPMSETPGFLGKIPRKIGTKVPGFPGVITQYKKNNLL